MAISSVFSEPKTADFIYIDSQNKVHLLLPIVGGNTIGLDNTCKTTMEIRCFFYGQPELRNSKNEIIQEKRLSALEVLADYQNKLEQDIKLLEKLDSFPQLKAEKKQRLKQIDGYSAILQTVQSKFINNLAAFPDFPSEIHHFLKKQTNCVSVNLSPETPDYYLRTNDPIFSLKRSKPKEAETHGFNTYYSQGDPVAGLGLSLRTKLQEALKQKALKGAGDSVNPKEQLSNAILAHYANEPSPSLNSLQDYITEKIQEKFSKEVNLKKDSTGRVDIDEAYFNAIGDSYDGLEMSEAIEYILNAALSEQFWLDIPPDNSLSEKPTSPFYDFESKKELVYTNASKLDTMTQFFLANTSVYLKSIGVLKKEFCLELDKRADDIAKRIAETIVKNGSVEDELFKIINEIQQSLRSHILTTEDKKNITESFTEQYNIIKESPHFDEFIFFLPDIKGDFFNHKNRISLHFLDLISTSIAETQTLNPKEKQEITQLMSSHQLQTNAKGLKSKEQRQLDPNNPIENTTFQHFLKLINEKNYQECAINLCSQIKNEADFVNQLSFKELNDLYNHPNWNQMKYQIENTPDWNKRRLYVDAIEYGKKHLSLMHEKLLCPTGGVINDNLINKNENWDSAIQDLKGCITSYKNQLNYFFKSSVKKSRIEKLEKILNDCQQQNESANLSSKRQILNNTLMSFNTLIQEIKESQPGKKSTLQGKIEATRDKFISLFQLENTPIGRKPEDPEQELLDSEIMQLPDSVHYKCLHHLNSAWWTEKGIEVIKQIPSSYYINENIDFFNSNPPSNWSEFHLKSIQMGKISLNKTNFDELHSRGVFIKSLEQHCNTSPIPEPLLNLKKTWWTEEGIKVIKQFPISYYTQNNIDFLNNKPLSVWDPLRLKAIQTDQIALNETTFNTLQLRGSFIKNLEEHYKPSSIPQSILKLEKNWWSNEGINVIKQFPERYHTDDNIKYLSTTNPSSWNSFRLKAVNVDLVVLNKDTNFESLHERGAFIFKLERDYGSLEKCKPLLKLDRAWWNDRALNKIKQLNSSCLNETIITKLNQRGPEWLNEKQIKQLNNNTYLQPKVVHEANNRKVAHEVNNGTTININISPSKIEINRETMKEKLQAAKNEYQKHTESKWFDFKGRTTRKNETIQSQLEVAKNALDNNAYTLTFIRSIINSAQSSVNMEGNGKTTWSWFKLSYVSTKSNEIFTKLIDELDSYIEQEMKENKNNPSNLYMSYQ